MSGTAFRFNIFRRCVIKWLVGVPTLSFSHWRFSSNLLDILIGVVQEDAYNDICIRQQGKFTTDALNISVGHKLAACLLSNYLFGTDHPRLTSVFLSECDKALDGDYYLWAETDGSSDIKPHLFSFLYKHTRRYVYIKRTRAQEDGRHLAYWHSDSCPLKVSTSSFL